MSVLKVKDNGVWKDVPSIKGDTGDAAGFGTATASVDTGTGTPSCVVTLSGEDTAKNFDFAFHNLMYDDSDLQSDFADLADDFDVLQGQFDTAVAALTVDSEVADIRVGDDGVTYTSAGAAVRGQFHDVKSAINHQTALADNYRASESKNILDAFPLSQVEGWAVSGTDYYGPIDAIKNFKLYTPFAEPSTQYTVSFSCYNATLNDTEGTGLIVYFNYSDGTEVGTYIPNNTSSWLNRYLVSTSGKTVEYIHFYKSAGTNNDTWHIKDLQIEKGTSQTAYAPYRVSAIDNIARDDIEVINYNLSNYAKYSSGKNIFDVSATNRKDGLLLSTAGTFSTNATYNTVFLPIKGNSTISCNTAWSYISFYTEYVDITALSAGDSISGNISGEVRGSTASPISVPATAKYYAMSYIATRTNIQVEYGSSETDYEPYTIGIPAGDVFPMKPIVYDIYADGTGDYADIRTCLAAITDASDRKPYEVHIHEGTYNLTDMFTAEEIAAASAANHVGLYVPNYVTLVGIGRRDNIIISGVLSAYNSYVAPLYFRNYGGMKNLTVTATKCRYTVHDDVSVNGMGGYRIVENCKIIGNDLDYGCVYGSGQKEDCHWEFINTIMDGTNANKGGGLGLVFLSHNQLKWTKPSSITFKNCRFLNGAVEGDSPTWKYAMRFRSLITDGTYTWNNMPVYVHMYGNHCDGIELGEDGSYGSGTAYWVDGYSNKNAWEHVTSTTTPPVTVADRFDLIGSY